MDTDRLLKEQSFHDHEYGRNDSPRKSAEKYYSINRRLYDTYIETVAKRCKGKRLLEYGCGVDYMSEKWLKLGALVTGIDISPEGIKQAKEKIASMGYQADYFVMDAENTEFPDNSFDIVVGTGIIHHLDLVKSYQELSRILTSDGHIVFAEPLGHNPFINWYRTLTPEMRTEDEHPLKQKDIKLLKQYFHKVEVKYFSLFTLFAVPFRNKSFFEKLYALLANLDKVALLMPFVGKYAWTVLIHASNPKKMIDRA